MNRVEHVLFGAGTVIESRTTESRQSVSLIRFDSSTVDRLILTGSLKPSSSAPDAPPKKAKKKAARVKGTRRRKTASLPVEVISDQLLVPSLDEALPLHAESVLEEYEEA